ncbi:uncharacterized protein APUU_51284A [Aspergillus puulaauensis]|uniref:Biogenesis of lysosome-related organelles complex 1 subunit 1 n=1 Tax=Aspergillus puulaauensis TaxID=1220207 RepID=A0A7R8AR62_9EURO|nr:uncharacterized protein APUU_51284A [Aspergillus puulaauensis]BCS26573.1 hypothetical protein APUU_51284A [Aspergillus puulaauensis]
MTLNQPSSPNSQNLQHPQEDPSDPQKPTREAVSAFTASLHSLGANYTSDLVDRAKNLHGNSEALRAQEEQLARTTADLHKQNNEWGKVADEARNGLKEIGDVQNWAEMIERDLLAVEEMLGVVEEEDFERERERERGVDIGESDGEMDIEGQAVNGSQNGNGGLNGNGKIGGEDGEDGKAMGKGNAKAKGPEKKGWFSWW